MESENFGEMKARDGSFGVGAESKSPKKLLSFSMKHEFFRQDLLLALTGHCTMLRRTYKR
jgi:hypothetical protein